MNNEFHDKAVRAKHALEAIQVYSEPTIQAATGPIVRVGKESFYELLDALREFIEEAEQTTKPSS